MYILRASFDICTRILAFYTLGTFVPLLFSKCIEWNVSGRSCYSSKAQMIYKTLRNKLVLSFQLEYLVWNKNRFFLIRKLVLIKFNRIKLFYCTVAFVEWLLQTVVSIYGNYKKNWKTSKDTSKLAFIFNFI